MLGQNVKLRVVILLRLVGCEWAWRKKALKVVQGEGVAGTALEIDIGPVHVHTVGIRSMIQDFGYHRRSILHAD